MNVVNQQTQTGKIRFSTYYYHLHVSSGRCTRFLIKYKQITNLHKKPRDVAVLISSASYGNLFIFYQYSCTAP